MKKPSVCLRKSLSGCFRLGLFFLLTPALFAEGDALTPPPGGTQVFSQDIGSNFWLAGGPDFGEKKMIATEGVPFTHAVELRTRQRPPNPWEFQFGETIPTAIHKGDVLWITLWMRATETTNESHEGFSELSIEQNHSPFDKLGLFDFSVGNKWQQFAWTCTAERDYASGETQICLRGGYAPQVIQVGGLRILNYGNSVKPSDLPHSKITYPGMEADAPWRKAAAERIEKYRKANVKVIVQDSAGQPLPGATVRIEEQRSAFGFGSCVVAKLIEGTGPDNDRYREIIKNSYSKVVMENDLKWGDWDRHAQEGHKTTLAALQWLHDQGIQIRGHNLVWPSWRNSPAGLAAFKHDPGALEQHIENHIKDIVGATKGQLTEWDVVNEPYSNHDFLDLLGPGVMASWFKLVHQIDPRPVLYLNDYAGLTERGEDTPHKDAFEKTLRALKAQGAPLGGLGIQAHFGGQLTGPEQIVRELDRWAALGLAIQITEFDLDFDDEQVQAQYTRDFMTAVFSHPAVNALLMWGFWEGAHWRPKAALYRKDWSIKPNGQAWNDLVLKQWHTDLTAQTDASGTVSGRGFLGQYQVTVTYHGASKTWPLTLSKEGAVLAATLPAASP
ncbi:MAG: endo-1,4-beta-xylanase [Methylacidiphilales bacterium]|nr:endo-1,4-beta-xylanase [Candidatus Methylacidiphilales bacterium]